MMQTKFITLFFLTLTAAFIAGCYKDKGNYDYSVINELNVTDTIEGTISVKVNDTLRINPQIEQSLESDQSNLTYKWIAYSTGFDLAEPRIELSTDRDLAVIIKSPDFVLGETYSIRLEVTDSKTGVSKYRLYNLVIVNEFERGWLFLEDINGQADFSMLLPDGRIYYNLYSSLNDDPLGKPVMLSLAKITVSEDMSPPGKRIYVLGEDHAVELNYQTLVKQFDYESLFFAPPDVKEPENLTWISSAAGSWERYATMGVIINNGIVYNNLVGGFPGTKKWGGKLMSTAGNYDYEAAPFVAGGTTYTAVVYDNTNKRFCYIAAAIGGAATRLNLFPDAASDPAIFDMNDVGMTMIYMDSSNIAQEYNAVMRDDLGEPYLLKFKTTTVSASPVVTLDKKKMNAPGFTEMTTATSATLSPHIYYTTGKSIEQYETTSNTHSSLFDFSGDETITKLVYRSFGSTAQLVAATWNGTEGKVYFFDVSATGTLSTTPTDVYGGFGKIVDLSEKNP